MIGLLMFVVIFVFILFIFVAIEQGKKQAEAKENYLASLAILKNNPTNAELRTETLRLGRVYSNLTRNSQGVTIFDEVALMNDIEAACAGAIKNNTTKQQEGMSIEERLDRLKRLRRDGHITDEEYETKKNQILNEL